MRKLFGPLGLVVVLALSVGAATASTSSATAAHARRHAVLRFGDRGQRVRNIEWLLAGNDPSVYRKTLHPYHGRIDGIYGRQLVYAVMAAKWRLGYPKHDVNGRTGRQLFEFLLGKRARPLGWIGRASARARAAVAGQTSCSRREANIARRELGVHEVPWGSNDGPRVRVYQSVTGAYHAPWCASFVQYVLERAHTGPIANRSAGVFYIVSWAHQRAWVHALPKPGALVAFMHSLGHIGLVTRVTRTGFYTIEGNSGDAVRQHWYPTGYLHTVFVWLPHCN